MKTKNTKKIMTVSGEYSVRNFTVADIQSYFKRSGYFLFREYVIENKKVYDLEIYLQSN